MRKSSFLICGVGLLLLTGLFLLGCGSGGSVMTAIPSSGSGVTTHDHPEGAGNFEGIVRSPDGGVDQSLAKQVALTTRTEGNATVVSISVEDVKGLTTFLYELKYDPTYHNPVRVEFSDFMGSGDEVITFSNSEEAGVVALASVMIHPEEAEGVSGSGEVAKVYFSSSPFGKNVSDVSKLEAVQDFALDTTGPAGTFTWSTSFFRGDGKNQDGFADIADIASVAEDFFKNTTDNPEVEVSDFNRDGTVDIADVARLAEAFFNSVDHFVVEVATDAENGTYAPDGSPILHSSSTGKTAGLFNAYSYTLTGNYPNGGWARIFFEDEQGNAGPPSTPVRFEFGPPPINILVDGIVIQITNTTNTTANDPMNGEDTYHSNVDPNEGTVQANTQVSITLTGFHYRNLDDNLFYGVDIPGLGAVEGLAPAGFEGTYNNLVNQFQQLLVSDTQVNPGPSYNDLEAFTANPVNPGDTALTGTVGPNDVDPYQPANPNYPANLVHVFATLNPPDSLVGGDPNVEFTAHVQLRITEDPDAPEIWSFGPPQQPSNQSTLATVSFDFGQNDWPPDKGPTDERGTAPSGEEYTAEPVQIQLINMSTTPWTVVTFTPEDNPNTADPPQNFGRFTWQKIDALAARPGEPNHPTEGPFSGTIIAQILVPSGLAQGTYRWRVVDSVDRKVSSLLKPFDTTNGTQLSYEIVGPVTFDFSTLPVDNIVPTGGGREYLYIFPVDPKIRVNPEGTKSIPDPNKPGEWHENDTTRYNIIRKSGVEFQVEVGNPMIGLSDAPQLAWLAGGGDLNTIDQAGGVFPNYYLQPHCCGYEMPSQTFDPDWAYGPVTLATFSQNGTKLGQVVRTFVDTLEIKQPPVVDAETQFGVNPWGDAGELTIPIWTDKTASKSNMDLLVLQVKGLWFRQKDLDDNLPSNSLQRSHVVEFYSVDQGTAWNSDVTFLPRVVDPGNAFAPAIVAIDISAPLQWHRDTPLNVPPGQYYLRWRDPYSNDYSDWYRDSYPDGPRTVFVVQP